MYSLRAEHEASEAARSLPTCLFRFAFTQDEVAPHSPPFSTAFVRVTPREGERKVLVISPHFESHESYRRSGKAHHQQRERGVRLESTPE